MASDPPSKKILIKYKFPDLYSPPYCNGAWGGFTAQGEVCLHFYLERAPLPNAEVYGVDAAGNLAGPIDRLPKIEADAMALRMVTTGVVMNITTAKAVVAFLQKKIEEHETAARATDKGKH